MNDQLVIRTISKILNINALILAPVSGIDMVKLLSDWYSIINTKIEVAKS